MKAEEEDQIPEEARLKAEEHKRARLKVEEEVLLTLEVRGYTSCQRRKAGSKGELACATEGRIRGPPCP